MADEIIDSLKIVTKGDSSDAVRSLDELLDSLGRFKNIGNSVNKSLTDTRKRIDNIATAAESSSQKVTNMTNAFSGTESVTPRTVKVKGMVSKVKPNVSDSATKPNYVSAVSQDVTQRAISPTQAYAKAVFNELSKSAQEKLAPVTSAISKMANTASSVAGKISSPLSRAFEGIGAKAKGFGDTAGNAFKWLGSKATSVAKRITLDFAKLAGSPVLGVRKAIGSVQGAFGNLFKMFKRRVMYRLLNSVISGVTNGIKTGIKNAYDYATATNNQLAKSLDSIATSSLYVKNSLGAMAAPIINALAPAIDWLADKFVNLLNIINQVISKLTGASTWIKAIKYPTSYGDAAKDATNANKELKKSILGIDEINPLTDNSNKGKGGNSSGTNASKMFETEELGDVADNFGKIFEPFKKAWDNQGKPTIESIKNAFGGVKGLLSSIGKSFVSVWQNGTGQKTVEIILETFQGIMNTIGNISTGLKDAWDNAGTGTQIVQNLWNTFNSLLTIVRNVWTATANWAKKVNFKPLMTSIENVTSKFKPLIDVIGGALQDAYEAVLLPLAQWFIEEAAPKSLDAVASALDFVTKAFNLARDALSKMYNALSPFIDWLKNTAVKIIDSVKTAFETLSKKLEEKSGKISGIFTNLGTAFKGMWKVFEPILNFITENLAADLEDFAKIVGDVFGIIVDIVSGICTMLAGIAEGDWKKVWRGFSSIFVNVWNGLKTVVADIVNSWIKSINKIIDTVNNLFHLNWSHIPEIYVSQNTAMTEDARTRATNKQNRITGRASGGMVEMGTMFYAGESGAEVVANIGNKTGVMNVGQLSAGVEDGVMHANETQNALLREIIYIIRNMPRDGSVSGNNGDFITAAQQKNRRDGKTTIPIGV